MQHCISGAAERILTATQLGLTTGSDAQVAQTAAAAGKQEGMPVRSRKQQVRRVFPDQALVRLTARRTCSQHVEDASLAALTVTGSVHQDQPGSQGLGGSTADGSQPEPDAGRKPATDALGAKTETTARRANAAAGRSDTALPAYTRSDEPPVRPGILPHCGTMPRPSVVTADVPNNVDRLAGLPTIRPDGGN